MEQHHVPGAAFVLVRDREVLFSKGYGYADLEHKTLMSPDKTILRVWSVSKTFAFAVLMRHHEQESFGLDDVYEYLNDVRVDETYPEPVTFEHLLTHTDGFEDRTVGIGARSGDDLRLTKGLKWFGAGYLIYIGLKSLERITKYPLPLAYHNPDSAPGGFRR